jgi:hypothetical protein
VIEDVAPDDSVGSDQMPALGHGVRSLISVVVALGGTAVGATSH